MCVSDYTAHSKSNFVSVMFQCAVDSNQKMNSFGFIPLLKEN